MRPGEEAKHMFFLDLGGGVKIKKVRKCMKY
jgi:hypothetical protein